MLKCQRGKFSITKEYVYLNCAYMSPLLQSVHDVGMTGLIQKSFPQEIFPLDFFEPADELRYQFAKLINAPHKDRIAIIPSVSYGLANAAKNIKIESHQNIILLGEQFPSNVYIWEELAADNQADIIRVHAPNTTENRGKVWNERLLSTINANTKVIAMAMVHWADGTLFDLKAIRKRADEVGALLIIDGAQSVGALPFDVQEIRPDALICVGYKWLMGPYSIGVAYYGEYFDNGKPIEQSWKNRLDSHNFSQLVNYQPEYKPMAQRYNVGEFGNFIQVPMLAEAIRQLNEWGVEQINEYCHILIQKPLRVFKNMGCWVESPEYCSPHLFGVRLPKHINIDKLQQQFQTDRIKVSIRGNSVRISPNVYNDRSDFERLFAAFEKQQNRK